MQSVSFRGGLLCGKTFWCSGSFIRSSNGVGHYPWLVKSDFVWVICFLRMNPMFKLIYGSMRHAGDIQMCSRPGFKWVKKTFFFGNYQEKTIFFRCHTRNKGSSRLYSWMGTLQCLNYFYHHNYDFTNKALTYGNMHPRIKELCRNFQNTDYSVGVDGGGLQIRETRNAKWVLTYIYLKWS